MARAIVMPSYGMYTDEGTLAQWLKPSGASVEAGEPIAEIETDKALAEVPAPESGILHHVVTPGAILHVESLIGYVLAPGEAPPETATGGETAAPAPAAPAIAPTAAPAAGDRPEIFASPNARRLAAEFGVDLATLTGSGPRGRITEDDVRAALGGGTG